MKSKIAFFLFASVIFSSCRQKSDYEAKQESRFRTYKGVLNIAADAGLEPILKQQVEVFEFLYDSVDVNISYKSENEMFEALKKREAAGLILTRMLTPEEISNFKTFDTLYTRELPVAYDAVALIGNKNFDDNNLDTAALKKYFASTQKEVTLVFDNQNSTIVKYMFSLLGLGEKVSPNAYALENAEAVIDYVEKKNGVIGFIPYNLVSDTDDDRVKAILKKIKILSLRVQDKNGKNTRVSANQSDIAEGIYPLIRTVNTLTRFSYDDNLELLFIGFLAKEKAARIFLKAGLIPVKMPEREIIVNESPVTGG